MADAEKIQASGDVIKKYLIGGAALGGGAALLTALINQLNKIKSDAADSSNDDDVLYVYKDTPQEKQAGWADLGLGIAGGTATALGTYALVNRLYQAFRAREAQKELDKAQRIFLHAQGYKDVAEKKDKKDKTKKLIDSDPSDDYKEEEQEKSAADGRSPSALEMAGAAPIALPLILALASGIVTNEILKSKYDTGTRPQPKEPRRIEIVNKPADDQDEFKSAAAKEYMDDDAGEFLIRMALAQPCRNSDLVNIVKNAAMGGHLGFKDTAMITGFGPALSMVKGASAQMVDPLAEHLAVCWLNKCARLKHNVRLVAAGEFAEQHPELYKQACNLPEPIQKDLYKIAGILGVAIRAERSQELGITADGSDFQVKQASAGQEEDILAELISEINKKKDNVEGPTDSDQAEAVTEGDEYESTGTSGEEAGIVDPDSPSRPSPEKKLEFVRAGKTMRRFSQGDENDIIDDILSAT